MIKTMPDTGITITREDPGSDLARELLARYFQELAARFPEGFDPEQSVAAPAQELRPPQGAFLVVRLNGSAVGCGGIRRLDVSEPSVAEVKRMWIDPAARGRGLARRLLGELETVARAMGCSRVRLDTSTVLTEAVALYRSAGYVDIPAYNQNQYAGHWFEKLLT